LEVIFENVGKGSPHLDVYNSPLGSLDGVLIPAKNCAPSIPEKPFRKQINVFSPVHPRNFDTWDSLSSNLPVTGTLTAIGKCQKVLILFRALGLFFIDHVDISPAVKSNSIPREHRASRG